MSTLEEELNNVHSRITKMPLLMKELTGCILQDAEKTGVLDTRLSIVYFVLLQNQLSEQQGVIDTLKKEMQDLRTAHNVFAEESIS